jgi:RNA polymerase-interacting CarD/CdnL/TRCF family regulator
MFKVEDRVEHTVYGWGTVVEIVPRTMEVDNTRVPIVKVTFDDMVRKTKTGEQIYTLEFTEKSLNEFIVH